MNSLEVMMVANKLSLNEDRIRLYSEIVDSESQDSSPSQ